MKITGELKKTYFFAIFSIILSIITRLCKFYLIHFLCVYISIALVIASISLTLSYFILKKVNKRKDDISLNEKCYNIKIDNKIEINDLYNYDFNGKLNNRILTNNEYTFFYQLKRITDKYNLIIFQKLRMADIFTTYNNKDFGKVKSKHIDFTICNWYTKPIIFIELDDYSHNKHENKFRDMKKDKIFSCMKVKLYRVKVDNINLGLYEIESGIKMYIYDLKKKVEKD